MNDTKPEAPVVVSAIDLRRLIETGDELARKLRYAPGIDYMRASLIGNWREAKEKLGWAGR